MIKIPGLNLFRKEFPQKGNPPVEPVEGSKSSDGKEGMSRRDFLRKGLKTGAIVGLSAFLPNRVEAGEWEKILTLMAAKEAWGRLVEKKENKKLLEETKQRTEKANERFQFAFPGHLRFKLQDLTIGDNGREYTSKNGSYGNSQVDGFAKLVYSYFVRSLRTVFPKSEEVASQAGVRRETEERHWERSNPEINQATVPGQGNIERENLEIDLNFQFFNTEKELKIYLGKLKRYWNLELTGLDLKREKMIAIGVVTFRDNTTQTEERMLIFGAMSEIPRESLSLILNRAGISLRKRKTNYQILLAIAALENALDNFQVVLSEHVKAQRQNIQPSIDQPTEKHPSADTSGNQTQNGSNINPGVPVKD